MSCWQCNFCNKKFLEVGWCPRDPNQACGWPAKTVRSMLAIIVITVASLAAMTVLVFLCIHKKWDIGVGVLGALLSIATGVLGYYFGFRSGQKNPLQNSEISTTRAIDDV